MTPNGSESITEGRVNKLRCLFRRLTDNVPETHLMLARHFVARPDLSRLDQLEMSEYRAIMKAAYPRKRQGISKRFCRETVKVYRDFLESVQGQGRLRGF